jgi:hypothetical protein
VHPSLFTDEAWVACSPFARLLYIGLWTDADDQGVFEWKPTQIKMRLFPGDDGIAMISLLSELAAAELIASFEHDGRKYGAIKTFQKFQRPKKPNALHPLPMEWRKYVCAKEPQQETEGETVPNLGGTVLGWRMEDGEEGEEEPPNPPRGEAEFKLALLAYPSIGLENVGEATMFAAWVAELENVSPVGLLAAVRSFAAGEYAKTGGRPKRFDRWLASGAYARHIPQSRAGPAWTGPPEVREALAAEPRGEGWARTWLDRCLWRDLPDRAVVTTSPTTADRLRREAGEVFERLGVAVVLEAVA